MGRVGKYAAILVETWLAAAAAMPARAADPAFQKWLEDLWPQAQALGISRRTFDAATHGLEPDLTLPDLDLPGREGVPPRGQAEFVQTPADYIKEATIARLAEQAKKLAAEHARALAAIEQQFGVPGSVLLALWGAWAAGCGLHDRRARGRASTRRMAHPGIRARLWPEAGCVRPRRTSIIAPAGRHLRAGVSDAQELLRHQGVQFRRSLRVVRG